MEKIQLCSGYTGADPVVRVLFFSSPDCFKGKMRHEDKAILAIKGAGVVGGLLLQDDKVICKKGKPSVQRMLLKEFKKFSH